MRALRKSEPNTYSPPSTLGIPEGFVVIQDKDTVSSCTEYLSKAWDGKREFRALAKRLGVSSGSICALLVDTHKINGGYCQVFHLVIDPNPKFSAILLECGAIQDNLLKGWMIPCTHNSLSHIRSILCKYFGLVLCNENNDLRIYANRRFREVPNASTELLIEKVKVTLHGIRNAIVDARPSENLSAAEFEVYSSTGFIPITEYVYTKLCWLVIRYTTLNKPRYCLINSLSWKIEVITYGESSPSTKVLIDRVKSDLLSVDQEIADILVVK